MARATAAWSIRLRVRLHHRPGALGELCTAIGSVGGNIVSLDGFDLHDDETLLEDVVVDATDAEHVARIEAAVRAVEGVELVDSVDRTFLVHHGGKIEVRSRIPLRDRDDLAMVHTPGVARVCQALVDAPERARELTIRRNTVAVVSDGTAVLGLGDIGPVASLPAIEGKALLFKEFAGVDAFPICLDVDGPEALIQAVEALAPTFGGIDLEHIAAPGAFEVERRLDAELDIPVFHDDQHGTAVVVLAALQNALHLVNKRLTGLSVVIAGAGAPGVAVARLLRDCGVEDLVLADADGALHADRPGLTPAELELVSWTNPRGRTGPVGELLTDADVFVGFSGPGPIDETDLGRMSAGSVVFALGDPDPEIDPELAARHATVVATSRPEHPNQINNLLAFPGIFRGALDVGATRITERMKMAAARAIAAAVDPDELRHDRVIPSPFDRDVPHVVARAVADAARVDGVARLDVEAG